MYRGHRTHRGLPAGSLGKWGDAGKAKPPEPCLSAQRAASEGPGALPSARPELLHSGKTCRHHRPPCVKLQCPKDTQPTGPLRQDGHPCSRGHGRLVGGALVPHPRSEALQTGHGVFTGFPEGLPRSSPHTNLPQPAADEKERNLGPGSRHFGRRGDTALLPGEWCWGSLARSLPDHDLKACRCLLTASSRAHLLGFAGGTPATQRGPQPTAHTGHSPISHSKASEPEACGGMKSCLSCLHGPEGSFLLLAPYGQCARERKPVGRDSRAHSTRHCLGPHNAVQ